MYKYLLGFIQYLLRPRISFFSLITGCSKLSRKARVTRFVKVLSSNIGSYSYISPHTVLVHAQIGKYCSIGSNCSIGLANHTFTFLSTSPIFTEQKNSTGFSWVEKNLVTDIYTPIKIGHDVWIGSNVTIMGGVKIGDGAIIGTGAIVTKDIPPYAVAVGVPAKVIKYRFNEKIISQLLDIEWWNLPEKIIRENTSLFQSEDINIEQFKSLKEKL